MDMSSDVIRTLDIEPDMMSDYWTILGTNTSRHAELVSVSGRTNVLVFGGVLTFFSLGLHATFLWSVKRKHAPEDRKSLHDRRHWFVISASLGQLAITLVVLPVELMTEYAGRWTSGPTFCQFWRPVQLSLVTSYFWSHFLITVERYLRVVRPRDRQCRRYTCFALMTSWIVSAASAVVVTVVMRHHGAMLDDVCAVDMSVKMAFLLSFVVYFLPVAFIIAASGALTLVTCRAGDMTSPLLGGHFAESAKRLANSSRTDSTPSLTVIGQCASAKLLASGADPGVGDLRASVAVVMATNMAAVLFWLPFYIVTLLIPFCSGVCLEPGLWTIFLWAGYSTLVVTPVVWISETLVRRHTGY